MIRDVLSKKKLLFRRILRAATYILLFDMAFIFIFPFIYMLVTSIKSPLELLDITIIWIPRTFFWQNYVEAFNSLNYLNGFKNSFIVTFFSLVGHILSCSVVGYGFARYKFPGRNILFSLVILSLIVPVQTIIFPQYILFSKLHWLNSFKPVIVPTFFGLGLRGGLFIFIFRQFFLGLPNELENAAYVDGCNPLKTFLKIILPTSSSAMLVTIVLSMVWHWNEYFETNIYLSSPKMWVLPSYLPQMFQHMVTAGTNNNFINMEQEILYNEAVVLAGTFMVILPLFIAYLFLQKYFMEGIERTGIVE